MEHFPSKRNSLHQQMQAVLYTITNEMIMNQSTIPDSVSSWDCT